MGKNLAVKFSPMVDERFSEESKATEIISLDNAKWAGVETVNVYSMPVVPMNDYDENNATDVYGPVTTLERSVQSMKINRKRTFNFKIRRLDKDMDQMASEVGAAIRRQTEQVMIPDYDHYVFGVAASSAVANGNAQIATKPSKEQGNAYGMFLDGMAHLGNAKAPNKGRIAVVSYGFYNLLKQDPAFVRYGDASQKMLSKGILGEVDGCKIMVVPNDLLPAGFSCLITHPYALTGPMKLRDVIVHDNPVGWNGWKVECLYCYDAFVLNEKANGIYYIGASGVNKFLHVSTSPSSTSSAQSLVTVMSPKDDGHTWKYATGDAKVHTDYGAEPNSAATWSEMTNGAAITPASSSDKVLTVVELDASGKVVGEGSARINIA